MTPLCVQSTSASACRGRPARHLWREENVRTLAFGKAPAAALPPTDGEMFRARTVSRASRRRPLFALKVRARALAAEGLHATSGAKKTCAPLPSGRRRRRPSHPPTVRCFGHERSAEPPGSDPSSRSKCERGRLPRNSCTPARPSRKRAHPCSHLAAGGPDSAPRRRILSDTNGLRSRPKIIRSSMAPRNFSVHGTRRLAVSPQRVALQKLQRLQVGTQPFSAAPARKNRLRFRLD